MSSRLIAIAGMSGAGKTALTRALAERLADQAAVLALDSYYHPLDHLTEAERAERNFDHPEALDWALLVDHLGALLGGASVASPVYLFDRHTRAPDTALIEPRPYVIVEGILALHEPQLRALAHLKVFVSAPAGECRRRRLARDIAERGRTEESVMRQYRQSVVPMARRYVLPTRRHADVIVSGRQAIEESVTAVLRALG
jgi:uridine kinase